MARGDEGVGSLAELKPRDYDDDENSFVFFV